MPPALRHRRLQPALLALVLLLAATALPARAHGILVSSTPAEGETVVGTPQVLTLTFDQDVTLVPDAVVLVAPDGAEVGTTAEADGPTLTAVPEADLLAGAWVVDWQVLAEDGHRQTGTFPITVTAPAASSSPSADATAAETASPTPASAPSPSATLGADPDGPGPLAGLLPDDGASVPVADEVVLRFERPVAAVADGGTVVLRALGHVVTTAVEVDGDTVLATPDEPLLAADWLVAWRVLDEDGEELRGATRFTVTDGTALEVSADGLVILDADGQPVPARDPDAPATSAPDPHSGHGTAHHTGGGVAVASAVNRAATAAGAITGVGLTAFLLGPHRGRSAGRRTLARTGLAGAGLAATGVVVGLALLVVDVAGGMSGLGDAATWSAVLGSANGTSAWVRLAGAALVAAGLVVALREGPPRTAALLGVPGALLVAGSFALVGHAAAAGPALPAQLASTAHVGAAAVWIGGVVGLLLLRREGPQPVTAARFATLAVGAVVVVALAGAGLAATHLSGPAALLGSTYGQLLVGKVLLVGGVVALGARHHRIDVPRIVAGEAAPTFTPTLTLELGLVVGVLLLTGALVGTAPG